MRAVVGIVSLLVGVAIVGLVAKKQLTATRQSVPGLATPAVQGTASLPVHPDATVKAQAQQIQQQYKQALESAMQQPRPAENDAERP